MKICFAVDDFDLGHKVGVAVSIFGDEIPYGMQRNAVLLPGRNGPVESSAESVRALRTLADWIERTVP